MSVCKIQVNSLASPQGHAQGHLCQAGGQKKETNKKVPFSPAPMECNCVSTHGAGFSEHLSPAATSPPEPAWGPAGPSSCQGAPPAASESENKAVSP